MKPRKRPKKIYVGLRLTEPSIRKIDALAKTAQVSRGEMIRQLLPK